MRCGYESLSPASSVSTFGDIVALRSHRQVPHLGHAARDGVLADDAPFPAVPDEVVAERLVMPLRDSETWMMLSAWFVPLYQ
jgi:hypothetical protein